MRNRAMLLSKKFIIHAVILNTAVNHFSMLYLKQEVLVMVSNFIHVNFVLHFIFTLFYIRVIMYYK